MTQPVLAKIMDRKGGMLVIQAWPWPIIYDTAAETSIFCSKTKRPDGVNLHRETPSFYKLTGIEVGGKRIPPIQCQLSDQEYKDPSSVFEYSPLILGMNFLTYSVPAPLFIDYANKVCGWGRRPQAGKRIQLKWKRPRNGLHNRRYLKQHKRTSDFLEIQMRMDGEFEPYIIDTGACCIIDNSGKHTEKQGSRVYMSNFEGRKIPSTESKSKVCADKCNNDVCERVCSTVPTRHAQKYTGKENLLGNVGLKILAQNGEKLFIYPTSSPYMVIGT